MIAQPPLQPVVFAIDVWHMLLWIIGTTVSSVAVSRWSSHGEHKEHGRKIAEVHECVDRRMARIEKALDIEPLPEEGD